MAVRALVGLFSRLEAFNLGIGERHEYVDQVVLEGAGPYQTPPRRGNRRWYRKMILFNKNKLLVPEEDSNLHSLARTTT